MLVFNGKKCQELGHKVSRAALIVPDDESKIKEEPACLYLCSANLIYLKKELNMYQTLKCPEKYLFYPTPTGVPEQRDFVLVAGQSGSGKSTWVIKWTSAYKMMHPTRNVYYFSTKETDKNIDMSPWIIRVKREDWSKYLGENYAEQQITGKKRSKSEAETASPVFQFAKLEELKNSCFVFDDDEEDPLADILAKFRMYLVKLGRQQHIDVIQCTHMITSFNKTRDQMNELSAIVVFPQVGVHNHMKRFFEEYMNMSKNAIKQIINREHQHVMVHLRHPLMALTDKKVWMITE